MVSDYCIYALTRYHVYIPGYAVTWFDLSDVQTAAWNLEFKNLDEIILYATLTTQWSLQ